jgi:type I restriction-modification system DNA methylase subunit
MLKKIINHIRERSYMSGVEREKNRVKATGEVFTPTALVQEILDQLPPEQFNDPAKTFLDNSCGDGQFLSEILIRKLENGSTFEQALSTIYGVDLMPDNVKLCQDRLLCGREDLRHIVEQNIVCADALRYHYRFDGSHPYDDQIAQQAREQILHTFFEEDTQSQLVL